MIIIEVKPEIKQKHTCMLQPKLKQMRVTEINCNKIHIQFLHDGAIFHS